MEALHLNTSLAKDPALVSNPVGSSAHPWMVSRDLRVSVGGIGLECLRVWFHGR